MNKYAVIVAGGSGTRMGNNLPKQFMLLNEKPVLYYTIKTFLNAYDDMQIILVLHPDYLDTGKEMVNKYFKKVNISIAAGGETRFQSVKNGLNVIEKESIIFVHDGVRCLITTDLIHRCYEMALATGSAIPVLPSKDSVRLLKEGNSEPFDRNKVMLVQTPQTFHSKILLPAYKIDYKDKFTDEATVVEAYGMKVSLVEGEETNIKITRPVDLMIAEQILAEKPVKNFHPGKTDSGLPAIDS
ncbi:MAG TPA: 2-C-methyl-D-erythritol 4-phosphate cytidylyltransferase [Chitinophagaceae bacterium]|nr:2-C-methyl-D-erythritol 4-phosphate cytidylyltransferase [Chitinophagaceae bacterium]